jgi:HSP20 family molecular chaperone IbpA
MGGLYVQQNEVPAGYQIRVHTGQMGLPVVDISVQGNLLVIRSQSSTTGGGNAMQMNQSGWSNQSISLPADANVAAMQMQRGNGVVEIFIPRGR